MLKRGQHLHVIQTRKHWGTMNLGDPFPMQPPSEGVSRRCCWSQGSRETTKLQSRFSSKKKKGIKNKWECLMFSKSQKGSSSLSGLLLSYRTDVDGHFAVSLPWEAITKPFPSWVRYPLSSRGQASHSVFLEVSMVTILQLPCTLCPQIPQTNGFYMPSFPIMYPITKQTFTFPYL